MDQTEVRLKIEMLIDKGESVPKELQDLADQLFPREKGNIDNCIQWIKKTECQIKELQERACMLQRSIQRLKHNAKLIMDYDKVETLSGYENCFYLYTTDKIHIDCEAFELYVDYRKIELKPDVDKIKEDLYAGKNIKYCWIEKIKETHIR